MRVKFSPKNIFLLISLVVAAAVSFLTFYIANSQFEAHVISNYVQDSETYVNSLALEYFDFDGKLSLKSVGEPDKFVEGILRNKNIHSANLTDANGLVIGSSIPNEINTSLHDDQSWEGAVGGTGQLTNLDRNTGSATLYLPLTSESGSIKGVVIISASLPNELLAAQKFTQVVVYVVLGSLLIFIIISYIAMAELEMKVEEKERSIFDSSKAQTEEKQLYEAITSSIAEALIVISKDKQIIMLNDEAEKLTGRKCSAVEYRSYEKIINFYDENGKKIKKDPIAQGLEHGGLVHVSSKEGFYLKSQSGILTPVAINVAPISADKSFVKGVAVTIIDISAEKELQQVKDEFVYVVAHELGNPIFALDGYLSLLKNYGKNFSKDGKEVLRSATEINRQLSSLVNDLLEVARNETGRLTFDLEPIAVEEILAEVVKNSAFKAKDKKVKLSSRVTKVPRVIGNKQKIKEVLTNLVDNAVKYTPSGGAVHADLYLHDDRVFLSVSDNGIGLSEDNKKHLFEKFFRVKNKNTEGISGTGLGLFISKQIIEKCGGKIWATSEEGKGSTFYISLKIAK